MIELFSGIPQGDYPIEFDSLEEKERFEKMLESFSTLNETGQKKAVERVEELAKIPDYQRKDTDE